MASKMSRRISAILVALMLLQCIPGNLIGNLFIKVKAESIVSYENGNYSSEMLPASYMYDTPYESEYNFDVEIPPTYIYEDNETETEVIAVSDALINSADINSVGGTSDTAVEPHKISEPIGAPFYYNMTENEAIDLSSGALIYKTTDYVLPGVNGLDLVIGRRYNSQAANETEEQDISFSYFTGKFQAYLSCTIHYVSYYLPDQYYGFIEYYDTYDAAVARVEEWESSEGELYYVEYKKEWGK